MPDVSAPFVEVSTANDFFPIGVWLQDPAHAAAYRNAGFNLYVGLWQGPTEKQLVELNSAGMKVVCAQNETALRHRTDTNILAWMHTDEPDNAQSWGARLGFSSPVPVEKILARYHEMKAADSSRPVLLGLGQGVAWDNWYGRGSRNHHPEDYPEYLKGCDIASFDIYPINHSSPEVAGNLWFVPRGIERLRKWTNDEKPVWNCIECMRIDLPDRKPTPIEVRAEVWMSLVHGSRGIIYFVHQFKPTFREAALLNDSEMLATVTALNKQITELAPILNSPTITNLATVMSQNPAVPVAFTVKHHAGSIYLFAVAMRPAETQATFNLKEISSDARVEVLGEGRSHSITNGSFAVKFGPWGVHLYRVTPPSGH